jgi:hypothetical protein
MPRTLTEDIAPHQPGTAIHAALVERSNFQ